MNGLNEVMPSEVPQAGPDTEAQIVEKYRCLESQRMLCGA